MSVSRTDEAEHFLNLLFPPQQVLPTDRLLLWSGRTKISLHLPANDPAAAALHAQKASDQGHDIYVGCGLRRDGLSPRERGRDEDVVAIPGVWCDIDVAHPCHKAKNLPPTYDAAFEILSELPEPTVVVDSGHGIHAWWLFKQLMRVDASSMHRAQSLVAKAQYAVQHEASKRGWHVDTTADLSRVLRLPGTTNHKENG